LAGHLFASALPGVLAYRPWRARDDLLGRSLLAQLASVIAALTVASAVYGAAVLALRIPEAQQVIGLLRRRVGRGPS